MICMPAGKWSAWTCQGTKKKVMVKEKYASAVRYARKVSEERNLSEGEPHETVLKFHRLFCGNINTKRKDQQRRIIWVKPRFSGARMNTLTEVN